MKQKDTAKFIETTLILAASIWQAYFGNMISDIKRDGEIQKLHVKLYLNRLKIVSRQSDVRFMGNGRPRGYWPDQIEVARLPQNARTLACGQP